MRFAPIPDSLPATVPFIGIETLQRRRGAPYVARLGANENGFGPSPLAIEAMVKAAARKRVRSLLETADARLQGRDWLAGFRSYADPYLFITLGWAKKLGIDLSDLSRVQAFHQRMSADPGVQAAFKAEGLM